MICQGLSRAKANRIYAEVLSDNDEKAMQELCLNDLFFLLTIGCKRADINKDWLYDRCREVEAEPDDMLDLWAREHYKSTIITFGKNTQDLLKDVDNITIGIFSHTRILAKGFLDQIKRELENNEFLKALFPDVLYQNPRVEAPKWSLDSGLILKRNTNPKEANVEAWGVVDNQPTGKHFKILCYDDIVTRESVTTPEQIKKTTSALELSYNLGAKGGSRRFIGTRYHANDTYKTIMERGTVTPRIYPATDNGKLDGTPVFLSREELDMKRRDMGPYTFGTQMLQDPVADKAMGFKEEWLKFYKNLNGVEDWNLYLLCDPASSKKLSGDYTVMLVIGLAPDGNYYLVDGIRDRLNLTERTNKLFQFHKQYRPNGVGYERYGMQSDIEHIQSVQEQRNYRFAITELGGSLAKEDRIRKLIPVFEQGKFFLPETHTFIDTNQKVQDLTKLFIEDEYNPFPVSVHDDMLDCMARIIDQQMNAEFPEEEKPLITINRNHSGGWVG